MIFWVETISIYIYPDTQTLKVKMTEVIRMECAGPVQTQLMLERLALEAQQTGANIEIHEGPDGSIQVHMTGITHSSMALDAHLWVVKEGKIIDLTTDVWVERAKECGGRLVYKPYPKEKSDMVVNQQIDELKRTNAARGNSWETWLTGIERMLANPDNTNSFDCVQSSIVYQHRNGGEIVAGMFGIWRPQTNKIHWQFGHPDETEWWRPQQMTAAGLKTYPTPITPDLIWDTRTPAKAPKQKPNDKCLCCSGKKYKKCCGSN